MGLFKSHRYINLIPTYLNRCPGSRHRIIQIRIISQLSASAWQQDGHAHQRHLLLRGSGWRRVAAATTADRRHVGILVASTAPARAQQATTEQQELVGCRVCGLLLFPAGAWGPFADGAQSVLVFSGEAEAVVGVGWGALVVQVLGSGKRGTLS